MANDKPTILVTRRLPEPVEARLVRDFDARLNPTDAVFGTDALIAAAAEIGADGLLMCPTERFTADVIERLPASVRIAASYSVGVDHVDLEAAAKRGLVITNTPDVLTDATAEVAMLLMLGAARRAHEGEKLVRSAAWKSWAPTFMLGTQLTGKRLGIVGMGGIGRATARRARAFGMTVHYHNRTRLSAELEDGATYHATLDGLLTEAEFLSIHCPATPETHHLLNAETIARLPGGAIVGQHLARHRRRRRSADRRPAERQGPRRRPRCLRGRARRQPGLSRAAQHLPHAAYRQCHGRDPRGHGHAGRRQPRGLVRDRRAEGSRRLTACRRA